MSVFKKNRSVRRERVQYAMGSQHRALMEQIKLICFLAVTGLCLIALETTLLCRLSVPFSNRIGWDPAAPSLGLLFAMAVGFLHGEREGGVTGLFAGWLADASGTSATGNGEMMILPLLYFLCGYLSGAVGRRRLARNLPSFLIFALVGGGLECLFAAGKAALSLRGMPPMAWVWHSLVPMWVLTVVFSPLVYGIVWGEQRIMRPK